MAYSPFLVFLLVYTVTERAVPDNVSRVSCQEKRFAKKFIEKKIFPLYLAFFRLICQISPVSWKK